MARPKSMTDFSNLIDPSYSLSRRERPRKKSSISLAAGLIMASEAQSPKSAVLLPSQVNGAQERTNSEGLFYAYIQKVLRMFSFHLHSAVMSHESKLAGGD